MKQKSGQASFSADEKKMSILNDWEAPVEMDISTADPETLVDIRSVQVNPSLPRTERVGDYLRQIKNPTCFKCGKIVVKLRFADSGETLDEKLTEYLHAPQAYANAQNSELASPEALNVFRKNTPHS